MTKKEIYEQVVALTAGLARTKVAEKIFSFANEGDPVKTQEVIDNFPKEYPELNQKIVSFGEKFNKLIDDAKTRDEGAVFGIKTDQKNEIFVFDTNVIDALSFYAFAIFAKIDETYLFMTTDGSCNDVCPWDNPADAVEAAGHYSLAVFVSNFSFIDWVGEDEDCATTVGELLVDIFAGEFDDIFEELLDEYPNN